MSTDQRGEATAVDVRGRCTSFGGVRESVEDAGRVAAGAVEAGFVDARRINTGDDRRMSP
ncbi:hypothetical protein [Diaminobutyricibacter sp. McL0608]|uniref:hypothetical protein n=1 Tax=Leifsonia sp. McL0608 TaxID=3143537 RepID=UPI0031F31197